MGRGTERRAKGKAKAKGRGAQGRSRRQRQDIVSPSSTMDPTQTPDEERIKQAMRIRLPVRKPEITAAPRQRWRRALTRGARGDRGSTLGHRSKKRVEN